MGIVLPQLAPASEDRVSGALVLDGSLKFDGKSGGNHSLGHLKRTSSGASGGGTFTISWWTKRGNMRGDWQYMIAGDNGSLWGVGFAGSSGQLDSLTLFNGSHQYSAAKFRDNSGWYHIVLNVNSSVGAQLWVNGEAQSNTNTNASWNLNNTMYIGKWVDSGTAHNYDGYLAQYTCIDGLELGPSYFAYTDPLTGAWRPKKFVAEGTTANDGTEWTTKMSNTSLIYVGSASNIYNGNALPWNTSNYASFNQGTLTLLTGVNIEVKGSIRIFGNWAYGDYIVINGVNYLNDGDGTNKWITPTGVTYPFTLTTLAVDTTPLGYQNSISAVEIDGVILTDNTTQNLAFGNAGFYLPLDGNTPIGEDQSGNGNDWTPTGFGGSTDITKATGALPILNTGNGGTVARPGVFGSDVSRNYTILGTSGGGLYRFDGITETNPPLSFVRGATYIFDYTSATSHPLAFSTTDPDSSTTAYTDGVNTATSNVTKITVPHDAPDTLYYYCTSHSNMNNAITVTTDETKADPYAWKCILAMPMISEHDVSGDMNCTTTNDAITNNSVTFNNDQSVFYNQSADPDGSQYFSGVDLSSWNTEQPWTVEFWWYRTGANTNNHGHFVGGTIGGTNQYGPTYRDASHNDWQFNFKGQSIVITPSPALQTNKWEHHAFTSDGNNITYFRDGVFQTTAGASSMTGSWGSSNEIFRGGAGWSSQYVVGHVCDMRVYTVEKYTTAGFIPASTNPDILPDTPSGIATKTKLKKITDGAVAFSGTGSSSDTDYLSIPSSSDFAFGTGDFTIEYFLYLNSTPSIVSVPFDMRPSNNNGAYPQMSVDSTLTLKYYVNTDYRITGTTGGISLNKWVHIALSRSGTSTKMFVDGIQTGNTYSDSINYLQSGITISSNQYSTSEWSVPGFISNFRVIKGTALYTSDFIPPTEPLTNVTNTKLLTCQTPTAYQIAAVAPLVSGINDGTVWSSSITSDSLFRSGFPAAYAFNGTTKSNTNQCTATPQTAGQGFAFTFGEGVPFTTLQMQCDDNNGGYVFVNGVDITSQLPTGSLTNTTITGVTSPLTSIRLISHNGDAAYLGSVTIDGTMLVDPLTPNGDAVTTNFNPFNTSINTVRGQEGAYATLNPLKKSSGSTLSNGNLDISMTSAQQMTFATMAFPASGKWYFECTANAAQCDVGIAKADASLSQYIGKNTSGYGYYTDGGVYHNDASVGSGSAYTTGDVVGVAFDADVGTCKWYKNGYLQVTVSSLSGEWFPGFGSGNAAGKFNFGQNPFKFPPPDGFQPLTSSTARPDTVVANSEKYFEAVTYTGNGSTQKIGGSSPSQNATVVGGTLTNASSAFNGSGANWATLTATNTNTAAHVDFAVYLTGITRIEAAFDSPSGSGDTRGRYNGANAGNTRTGTGSGYSDIYNGSAITITSVGFGINQNGTTGTSSDIVSRFRITDSQGTRFIVDRTAEGLRFKPDFVWIKQRSSPDQNHALFDSIRGSGHNLSSSTNHGERSDHSGTTGDLSSFDTNGFSLGSSAASGARPVNLSGKDIVAWCWKAGGSAGTFNIDDVGYANASDAKMSVGSLNNDAYDQTQLWRGNITSSNGWNTSYPVTNIFNGSFDGGGGAANNGNGGVITFTPPAAITVTKLELSCYNPVTLTLPDGTTREVAGVGSVNKDVTVDIGSGFSFTGSNSITISRTGGFVYLERIKINGKELVDNDITPTNVPSIAATGSSVGTKQGFSVIKYSHTVDSYKTIAHGLLQAPQFIIAKYLDGTTNWNVYHASASGAGGGAETGRFTLNNPNSYTNEADVWGDTPPTDKVWTVGGSAWQGSGNHISYLWHDVPGLQKFGKYTANNSADGPYIELGFRPALVICKSVTQGQPWQVYDTARSSTNPTNRGLQWSSHGFEYNSTDRIDILSNGFKIRAGSGTEPNVGTNTYVYCAWAEAPAFNLYGAQSNAR